ncbi:hypothetical protein IEQ34_005878 [Dendrobium chrysotoxum]|uniref:Uncharacterized protein n=1 Tax=Dendrobium chrysotoxum TaxID=161865 RepID=A0AAV7HCC7_DENCH|nr:hypothetical protein IEQ34_005878 [Dendrobium chrysotoxum]
MASKKVSSAAPKSFLATHKKFAYRHKASGSAGSAIAARLKYSSALHIKLLQKHFDRRGDWTIGNKVVVIDVNG